MTIAVTPRLTLRQSCPDDLGGLAAILSDPEVMRFSVAGSMTLQRVASMLERVDQSYKENGFGLWAVEPRVGLMIGYCGLLALEVDGKREIEIGYRLARNYWGGGLATEAAGATRDHAFRQLGLRRLVSLIVPETIESVRVAEKNGMHHERDTTKGERNIRVYALQQ